MDKRRGEPGPVRGLPLEYGGVKQGLVGGPVKWGLQDLPDVGGNQRWRTQRSQSSLEHLTTADNKLTTGTVRQTENWAVPDQGLSFHWLSEGQTFVLGERTGIQLLPCEEIGGREQVAQKLFVYRAAINPLLNATALFRAVVSLHCISALHDHSGPLHDPAGRDSKGGGGHTHNLQATVDHRKRVPAMQKRELTHPGILDFTI